MKVSARASGFPPHERILFSRIWRFLLIHCHGHAIPVSEEISHSCQSSFLSGSLITGSCGTRVVLTACASCHIHLFHLLRYISLHLLFLYCGWRHYVLRVVCPSIPFLLTPYLSNTLREFFHIWYKCSQGLKNEFVRFLWGKVKT